MGRGAQSATPAAAPRRAAKKTPSQNFEDFKAKHVNVRFCRSNEDVRWAAKYLTSLKPSAISLDFETASKNGYFGSYNGSLRLIQIGIHEPERGIGPEQIVIDCHRADPLPIVPLLRNRAIEKQIHYMDFEQEWAQIHLGTEISNVYDTCVAGRVIQKKLKELPEEEVQKILPGWEKHNNKLSTLVRQWLHMEIPKDDQSSDWGRRRLTANQLVYAAVDVAILPPLVERTKELAEALGVSKDINGQTSWLRGKIRDRVGAGIGKKVDDSRRVERALKRASSVEELDQVMSSARQMTVVANGASRLRDTYRARAEELRDELPF